MSACLARTVPVEHSIRPLALTCKDALFDGGDERWAVIASLIETCEPIGVVPYHILPTSSPGPN
jgi:transposase